MIIYFFLGALIITFLLTRLFNWIFQKKFNKRNSATFSFFITTGLCFLLGSHSLGIQYILYIYVPCLLIWLLYDWKRASKTTNN